MSDPKTHWENIYSQKQPNEVSWWQDHPTPTLEIIHELNLNKATPILDVGGGDSTLADHLLEEGYSNITVLDISEKSIQRAKQRLGKRSAAVTWIPCNILDFEPPCGYGLWHDRATFHFLTTEEETAKYQAIVRRAVLNDGYLILATFSTNGPRRCSGLPVKQYDALALSEYFKGSFTMLRSFTVDHRTPSHAIQNFQFCCFRKIKP